MKKDLPELSEFDYKKNYRKRVLKFSLLFFFIFISSFYYQDYLINTVSGSNLVSYLINSLIFIIFFITVYRIKFGIYLFIFLLPLLNTLTRIIGTRDISVVLLLFLGLILGFIIGVFKNNYARYSIFNNNKEDFYTYIYRAFLILSLLMFISSLLVIYRYTNFFPFITNEYYDLVINNIHIRSTESIFWTIRFFINYIIGFGFFYIIVNTFNNFKDILITVIILIFSTIISSFIGFYQYFIDPFFGNVSFWVDMNRINATLSDPNALGTYSVMVLPIFISLILYSRKWFVKLIVGTFCILFVVIIFFSGSRSAFLGLVISSIIFIFLGLWKAIEKINSKFRKPAKYKKFLLWIAVIIILLVLLFLAFNFIQLIIDRIASYNVLFGRLQQALDRVSVALKDGNLEMLSVVSGDRKILWDQAVDMSKDHPISGVGVGAYKIELPNYYVKNGMSNYGKSLVDFTGNYYLQILSELGFPALLLIIFIFYMILNKIIYYLKSQNYIRNLKRNNWLFTGFYISLISMLVSLIFGSHTNFDEIQLTFWMIIGLMLSFVFIDRKKNSVYFFNNRDKPVLIEKISLFIIIAIFASSAFIGSATNLSINVKQVLYDYNNKYGYYGEENYDGRISRWTGPNMSELINKEGDFIIIPVKAQNPDIDENTLLVYFYIDNYRVKTIKINDDNWHEVKLKIPENNRGRFTFTMRISRTWSPREWGLSGDTRELGIMQGEYIFY